MPENLEAGVQEVGPRPVTCGRDPTLKLRCAYPHGNPLGGFQRRDWKYQLWWSIEIRHCEYPCPSAVRFIKVDSGENSKGEDYVAKQET